MNSKRSNTNEQQKDEIIRNEAWDKISRSMVLRVGADTYERWFTNASVFTISDSLIEIIVESDTHQLWIETNYMPELQAAVSDFFGENHVVSVIVEEDDSASLGSDSEKMKTYCSAVGKLLYLIKISRPDLSNAGRNYQR